MKQGLSGVTAPTAMGSSWLLLPVRTKSQSQHSHLMAEHRILQRVSSSSAQLPRPRQQQTIDLSDLGLAQHPIAGRRDLRDLVRPARADDGCGHLGAAQRPGDRELAHAPPVPRGDGAQRLDQRQVGRLAPDRGSDRSCGAHRRRASAAMRARELAGQQARRHRAVDDDADVVGGAERQQLGFDPLIQQAVRRLQRRDGMDRPGRAASG